MINTYRCRKNVVVVILISLIIVAYVHFHALRSYVIMIPYSYYHNHKSLLKENDYFIHIPSDNDRINDSWYPAMLVFHDDKGFGKWVNKPVELTVLYRFGGFKIGRDHATYFDRKSDKFSSFYGAYIIKSTDDSDTTYGYNEDNGELIIDDIMRITEYDQRWLVMPSIGLSAEEVIFEVEITDVTEGLRYTSDSDLIWSRVNAFIRTNSPEHQYQNQHRGYLQYGVPVAPPEGYPDYYPITLAGRVYVTKNEDDNTMIALYVLAVDFEAIDQIDNQILSNTTLNKP